MGLTTLDGFQKKLEPRTSMMKSRSRIYRFAVSSISDAKAAAVSLLGTLVIVGCSGPQDARLPVFPVKGSVSVAGEIPDGALVVLYPTGQPTNEIRASGKVKADGSFSLSTYEADDGAPAGDYVATIQWNKLVKTAQGYSAGPNVISKNYSDPASSVWKVKVAEAPNELPPIVIKK